MRLIALYEQVASVHSTTLPSMWCSPLAGILQAIRAFGAVVFHARTVFGRRGESDGQPEGNSLLAYVQLSWPILGTDQQLS